ncbi:hypothetical protein SDC9_144758 [bioreactor metagenome]|uniref:Uncharacterized protein n=1 Tax=bioreactor metagenome TaxID=1076179 RepID=A0A645E9U2_9ZZZZ
MRVAIFFLGFNKEIRNLPITRQNAKIGIGAKTVFNFMLRKPKNFALNPFHGKKLDMFFIGATPVAESAVKRTASVCLENGRKRIFFIFDKFIEQPHQVGRGKGSCVCNNSILRFNGNAVFSSIG